MQVALTANGQLSSIQILGLVPIKKLGTPSFSSKSGGQRVLNVRSKTFAMVVTSSAETPKAKAAAPT